MQISSMKASEEASFYHDSEQFGYAAILQKKAGKMHQTCRLSHHLFSALDYQAGEQDVWVSQAEFSRPNRRLINLHKIKLLFADLDTYKVGFSGEPPEQLVGRVFRECYAQKVPPPTLIVFSGQGLQVKWVLERAIPQPALLRWNLIQQEIIQRLHLLGADPAAKDASRVLRVPNTINGKNGKLCEVVYCEPQNIYNFEYFAGKLLPVRRSEIEANRQKSQKRVLIKQASRDKHQKLQGNLTLFDRQQLAWDRLKDLRQLQKLRGGVIPEGQRMINLFWRINFLLNSGVCFPSQMWHEAVALAQEVSPYWDYQSRELITLYHKAKDYREGKKIEFNGKLKIPIYTPKNEYLINTFQITDDEQKHLKTIISSSVSQDRHRERARKYDEVKRRKSGAIPRAEYLQQADDKRGQILELREQGLSVRKIAEKLGVSKSHVGRIIKN